MALLLLALGSIGMALAEPVQQAYLNEVIPAEQRATVLSFRSLMGNAGAVVAQPALGRIAEVHSLGFGYLTSGILYGLRLPFLLALRRMRLPADEAPPRPDARVG